MINTACSQILGLDKCVLCGISRGVSDSICHDCLAELPASQAACLICARALSQTGICGSCQRQRPPVDRTIAAFHYYYPVDRLIKNLKYKQRLSVISGLTSVLVAGLRERADDYPEVLVPVPLHFARLYIRGYNQSLEICKFISRQLSVPYGDGLVRRRRYTLPMSQLQPEERLLNVRGAFIVRQPLRYKTIAIIDDVVTSGATSGELARCLKASGAERVELWALARA